MLHPAVEKGGRESVETAFAGEPRGFLQALSIAENAALTLPENDLPQKSFQFVVLAHNQVQGEVFRHCAQSLQAS